MVNGAMVNPDSMCTASERHPGVRRQSTDEGRKRQATRGTAAEVPAWMATGLRGLARMTADQRAIAIENLELLVNAAYGCGSTPAMRGPDAQERSRDLLVRLGWAEPTLFIRCTRTEVLLRMHEAIAGSK